MAKNDLVSQVRVALLTVTVLFYLSSVSVAATYYVDATRGNDGNAGTAPAPWRKIQKAADAMAAGDTVIVNAGSYAERVQVTKSGTAGAPISYQAQGTVVTQGFTIQTSYIRVVGFEITNSNTRYLDGIGVYVEGQYNEVTNNYIHDLFWEGIWLFGGSSRTSSGTNSNVVTGNRMFRVREAGIMVEGVNNIVEGNDISHTIQYPTGAPARSGADADGLRFFGSGHVIRKNHIHDILLTDTGNVDPHIDCFQTWGPATNIIFEQNICHADPSNFQIAMISNSAAAVSNLTFRNNIFYDATRGINLAAGGTPVPNIVVINNTFKNLQEQAVLLANAPNAKIQNNLFYDVGGMYDAYLSLKDSNSTNLQVGYNARYATSGTPGGSPYPNDVWQIDPKVVNADANDFHLQATSPLIDTGVTLTEVATDYDSVARPQGVRSDIGTFEFRASTLAIPIPPQDLSVISLP